MNSPTTDNAGDLRSRIRALGVAEVARAARVPATTVYSFCQSATRQLGYRTAREIEVAVMRLEAEADGLKPVSEGPGGGAMFLPVIVQAGGYQAQLRDDGSNIISVGQMPLDMEKYRQLADGRRAKLISIIVTSRELSSLLLPGDMCVVDVEQRVPPSTASRPFLVRARDRLVFANCSKAKGKRQHPSILFDEDPSPPLSSEEHRDLEIIGRLRWFSRTLAD